MKKLSVKEYDEKVRELIEKIRAEVIPFESRSIERVEKSKKDFLFFCKTFLPHYFDKDWGEFHHEVAEVLGTKEKVIILVAPRGFGKTSFITIAYTIYSVLHGKRFVLIVSDTQEQAEDFLKSIGVEFIYNKRIQMDYEDKIKGVKVTGQIKSTLFKIVALGKGQKIRGRRFGKYRPDLVVIDDFENDKNVKNIKIVKEGVEWILGGLLPGLSAQGWELIIVGNKLSKFCVITELEKKLKEQGASFIYKEIPAIRNGKSTWEAMYNLKTLENLKKIMGSTLFNREYMHIVAEEGFIKEEWIKYVDIDDTKGMQIVGYFDPAISFDYQAFVTLGYDGERYIVLETILKKCSLREMFELIIKSYEKYNHKIIGVESNAFQSLILDLFDREEVILPLSKVVNYEKKEYRIMKLSPLIERGKIVFTKNGDWAVLEEQLLYYGSEGVHDDGLDALEGAVRLFERKRTKIKVRVIDRYA